jgi:hypothetical protein
MAVSMKMTAFWDAGLWSLAETDGRFRGAYCHQADHPNDGNNHLLNVGQFVQDCTAQYPRKQKS